ncbi:MAG: ACT domain-containing protein [Lachnospiraceae bacterium]
MAETKYYVVTKKALPEVLLKVVEAKRYLESGKASAINEATDMVGISRSSFYKYKDDIFPFHENVKGKTITFVMQMDDIPGILSLILQCIAAHQASILTIHQTIPINGIASLTLSVDLNPKTEDCSEMLNEIEKIDGVHYLKLLGRE